MSNKRETLFQHKKKYTGKSARFYGLGWQIVPAQGRDTKQSVLSTCQGKKFVTFFAKNYTTPKLTLT